MKRNDIINALRREASDIEIPDSTTELKKTPITVVPLEIRPKRKRLIFAPIMRIMVVLILSIGFFYSILTKAETKITIDINPSMEFTVNRFNKVVSVKAYNDSGEVFIKKLNLSYCTTEEAINKIINLAEDMDYVSGDSNAVLLSVSSLSNSKYEYENKAKSAIENAFRQVGKKGKIFVIEPQSTDEQIALKRRISPAKLAFARELYERRIKRVCKPSEVPDELINSSVAQIAKELEN